MRRKKSSSLYDDVLGFTKAGVGLGIGAGITASVPGGSTVTPAFSAAGGMMAPLGTAIMAKHTIRQLGRYKRRR